VINRMHEDHENPDSKVASDAAGEVQTTDSSATPVDSASVEGLAENQIVNDSQSESQIPP